MVPMPGLTPEHATVLAFARDHPRPGPARDDAVLAVLGMSPTRYHQVLTALLDEPAALAADPVLVWRLRRARDAARQRRTA